MYTSSLLEDVQILTGKEDHLGWVKRSLQVCRVAAYVKSGNASNRYQAGLFVPAKDEERARFLAKAYIDRCNADMLVGIDVKEVFCGSALSSSNDEFVG